MHVPFLIYHTQLVQVDVCVSMHRKLNHLWNWKKQHKLYTQQACNQAVLQNTILRHDKTFQFILGLWWKNFDLSTYHAHRSKVHMILVLSDKGTKLKRVLNLYNSWQIVLLPLLQDPEKLVYHKTSRDATNLTSGSRPHFPVGVLGVFYVESNRENCLLQHRSVLFEAA